MLYSRELYSISCNNLEWKRIWKRIGIDILLLRFNTKLCPIACNPMDCSTPGSSVLHYLPEFAQTHVRWVSGHVSSSHLVLCHLPLLLPSVFPSNRVISSESALFIRWPKYRSFSFSISSSNEYSELISFRIDWFGLRAKELMLLDFGAGEDSWESFGLQGAQTSQSAHVPLAKSKITGKYTPLHWGHSKNWIQGQVNNRS